ncbi:sodium-independent sulfate anion transporter-like [Daphnia pulex]|uniref:sodium-independent sulfate anion transporter-like n=1 Tax=Daphnia pulex TaxID=6669 RepID=UPI001EDCEF2E|nr:sodium-independent sulfate anion transporter-like [Daphnia pulex]XP_046449222.1 sodium-independent sulfate anion transporter-like [Daphnia pulex]XP_046449227.1 sodium-independent sulfate anion transporter-like [Daphnia pulex]
MKRAVEHSNNDSTFPIEESKVNNLKSMGTCYEWKRKARSKVKGACTVELLRRRFPILKWLPSYNWDFAVYDIIAGITVGLTTIPQGIAYAAVAGLPLQYGLYSAFMGLFVYVILGTSKECSIGPTAVMSLMTFSYASEGGPIYSTLLAFLAGWLELVAGLLNLGFMVEFISAPVISGFCSAAALTVSSTQVKGLFGLKFKGSSFIETWRGFFENITKCNPWDSTLGCSMIVILLLMRKLTSLKNLGPLKKFGFLRSRAVDSSLWFIATSRNAIAVIAGCLAAYFLEQNGSKPFTLTGNIQAGIPPFGLPPFSVNRTTGNTTVVLGFSDICLELGAAIGLIPLIAILEQVAIAKAFANGKRTDATQEMIALGVGTILGSLFSSMPVTASFGRSSVQAASGAKTPLTNIYGGVLVLLALGFLMPSLAYIPKAILASVIITSVIFMVELEELKPMWKSRKIELLPFGVTFLCCLFVNMEYGILIGAGIHLLLLAYIGNRPHPELIRLPGNEVTEERVIVKADSNLYFPGVEKFRRALNEASEVDAEGRSPCLMIDLSNLTEIDYSALKMLVSVASECHKKQSVLHFVNATPKVAQSISSTLPSADIAFLPKVDKDDVTNEIQMEEIAA